MVESSVTMSTIALDWDWNVCWKLRYLALRTYISTLGPRQNGRYFPDDIFKLIFLNETVLISIKISLKFVPMGPINNIPALVQIMAWRWPGDKPLSESMMVSLLTHICFTRPQWFKIYAFAYILEVKNFKKNVTILVLRLEYSGINMSISWLLMPWLLASPSHQPPWYWLHGIIVHEDVFQLPEPSQL